MPEEHPEKLPISGGPIDAESVVEVALRGREISLDAEALQRVGATRRAMLATLGDGLPHYGINTGFGSFAKTRIGGDDLRALQHNLLRSHAAGLGEPLPVPVVRAMLLLLVGSLMRARSGVRPEVIEALAGMLNAGVTPVVPELGSVGASGDLAPLAHAALVLTGEGEAWHGGRRHHAAEALRRVGLAPIALEAKEGLALINGTHLMAGRLALACHRLGRLLDAAVTAAAMSIDACRASHSFLDPRVYQARGHNGPARVAAALRGLLGGSEIKETHLQNDPRVQDPYSLRCVAVVLGPVLDLLTYARTSLHAELDAVTDNPLVFPEGEQAQIISAGNFHGMPVAIPLDALAIGVSHIAGISERRLFHMLGAFDPEAHLNPYLSPKPGLHSGLMIAQYTAAALVNEIVGLATPASVVNIPTSAGMEDYNSFGPRSGAKLDRSITLATSVIAIELLAAAQALEAHRPHRSGEGVEAAHRAIREAVPPLEGDRPPAPDIETITGLIEAERFSLAGNARDA